MCNHTPFVLHKFINDHAIDGYNHDTGRKFGNLIVVLKVWSSYQTLAHFSDNFDSGKNMVVSVLTKIESE